MAGHDRAGIPLPQGTSRASLQDVSGNTEDGSKTGTGGGESLVGSAGELGRGRGGGSTSASRRSRDDRGGGVLVRSRRSRGRGSRDVGSRGRWLNVHRGAGGRSRLGDGARAVSDGEGGSLGDGVGLATVGDLGRLGAVGGVGSHNLGDIGRGSVVAVGGGASNEGGGSGDGSETHFDGFDYLRWVLSK